MKKFAVLGKGRGGLNQVDAYGRRAEEGKSVVVELGKETQEQTT